MGPCDSCFFFVFYSITEAAHDKTYYMTCVTSKESRQPVYPFIMTRVLIYPSLDSLEAVNVKGTCDQRSF